MQPPFVYYGSKIKVQKEVWSRFGKVRRYIEPFAGSCAVLLGCPYKPKEEIINDIDGLVTNFWRSAKLNPNEVAHYANNPINQIELYSKSKQIINERQSLVEKLKNDPDYYNAKLAGWWLWCMPQSIDTKFTKLMNAKPRVICCNGIHADRKRDHIPEIMQSISERLKHTRVLCCSWKKILIESNIWHNRGKMVGVFLDPPYNTSRTDRYRNLYTADECNNQALFNWCMKYYKDCALRIALCGYEGEYDIPDTWSTYKWISSNTPGAKQNLENREKERIWFSPSCRPCKHKDK